MTITAVPADSGALMIATTAYDDILSIASGVESVPLVVISSGIVTLTVTASDGVTSSTYFFRTFFLQGSDSSLQSLSLSPGSLSPPFTPAILSYTASFDAGGGTATLVAAAADSAAAITVGTGKLQRGKVNQAIVVSYGTSALKIRVTSENEANSTVYTVVLQAPQSLPNSAPNPPLVNPGSYPQPPPPVRSTLSPTVQYASGPVSLTRNNFAQFIFYATNATGAQCTDCSFFCALDSALSEPCGSANPVFTNPGTYTVNLTNLPDGGHAFWVSASNPLGYMSPTASFAWVIDNLTPVTSITANIPVNRPTSLQRVVFNVTARDPVLGGSGLADCPECFSECSMDSGPYLSCSSGQPLTYFLQPGQHTFGARSMDPAGNQEVNPARFSFLIDTTPPKTQLTFAPVPTTGTSYARFQFVGSIGGSQPRCANCTFQCGIDDQPGQPCLQGSTNGAGAEYRNVSNGAHTFRLVATDPDGVLTSTLTYAWTAVLVGPDVSITYNPPALTALSSATFKFSAFSSGATSLSTGSIFFCSLDGSTLRGCDPTAGAVYTNLYEGVHTFAVRAEDVFGHVGALLSYTWQVNFSLPLTEVTSGPPAFSAMNVSDAVLTFVGTVESRPCATCTYACQLNAGPFSTCDDSTPLKLVKLTQGLQSLTVKVTDVRGVSTLSAPYQWIVDTIPPTVTISDAPPPLSSSPSATFTLSAKDANGANFTDCPQCTYRCSLDWGPFTPCANPVLLAGMGQDSDIITHVFTAVSVDPAGNQALTPAVYNWTVDRRPPVIRLISGPPNPTGLTDGLVRLTAQSTAGFADCSGCAALCYLDNQAPFLCNASADPSEALLPFAALDAGAHAAMVVVTNPLGVTANYTFSWLIDFDSPNAQILSPASVVVGQNPFQITVAFTKACNGFSCVSLTSCEVVISGPAFPDPSSFRSSGEREYTFDVLPIGDGQIDIRIPAGVCSDAAGNVNNAASASVTYEAVPPQPVLKAVSLTPIEITTESKPNGTNGTSVVWATNKTPIPFLVDFGKAVTEFKLSGIVVNGGRAQGLTAAPNGTDSSGSLAESPGGSIGGLVNIDALGGSNPASVFSFRVWPTEDGPVRVQIPADSCSDAIGNSNGVSDTFAVEFDTVAPRVTLTERQVAAPDSERAYVLVQFSERVVDLSKSTSFSAGGFDESHVSADGCRVADVTPQADGLSYLVTIAGDVSGSASEGRVWIAGGAVTDLAGNPNTGSEVLEISFGTVSSAAAAHIALGPSLVAGGLAATTGLSIAAALPSLVAQISALPGALPGTLTPYAARGNMVGVIGTVQTFALLQKLAMTQSGSFSKVAGSLAWVNLESPPSVSAVAASATAETTGTNGTNGSAPPASRRRLLQLNGSTAALPLSAPAPAPDLAANIAQAPSSLRVSGFLFCRVGLSMVATSLARALLAVAWWRLAHTRLPDALNFPRLEILAGISLFYAYTQACTALMQGGSALEVFFGSVLLAVVPCGAIVAILCFLGLHVLPGTSVLYEEHWQPSTKATWQRSLRTALFGSPLAGQWVETTQYRHPRLLALGGFGPLFHPFRPPETKLVGRTDTCNQEQLRVSSKKGIRTSLSQNSLTPEDKSPSRKEKLGREAVTSFKSEIVEAGNGIGASRLETTPCENGTIHGGTVLAEAEPPAEATDSGSARARSFCQSARALVGMLRTCHVGALLTKRLVFGALLGGVLTRSGADTWQVGSLLATSLAYVTWLLVGKPYVSRAVQGVETFAAALEVLTLCLALESMRAAAAAAPPTSARTLGNAMLALQLFAITGQCGCQCWAAVVELRVGWLWWREARLTDVNQGSERVKHSLGAREMHGSAEGPSRKKRFRAESEKCSGISSVEGPKRRRNGRAARDGETGRGSALTSAPASRQKGVPDRTESPVGRLGLTGGRLIRMLTGRKKEREPERFDRGDRGLSPRAEAALDSSAERQLEGITGAKEEGGGRSRVGKASSERNDGKEGLRAGQERKGGRKEEKEKAKEGTEKAKDKRKHAHFAESPEMVGAENGGRKRPFDLSSVRNLALPSQNGKWANGIERTDRSVEKRLIRMKSRRKEADGTTLSSFTVDEDPDAGISGFASNETRLLRLKSWRKTRGGSILSSFTVTDDESSRGKNWVRDATLASFEVSDAEESESEEATTPGGPTMRVVVRKEVVTSYTVVRGHH